jgi:hypothetical protein
MSADRVRLRFGDVAIRHHAVRAGAGGSMPIPRWCG